MPTTWTADITDIVKPHYERGIERALERGMQQGRQEGVEYGLERGRQEAHQKAIEAARKMLAANEPLEKVTLYTGLSLEELKQQGLIET